MNYITGLLIRRRKKMTDLTRVIIWLAVIGVAALCQERDEENQWEDFEKGTIEWNCEIENRLMGRASE